MRVALCSCLFWPALAICGGVRASSAAAHRPCCLRGAWDLGYPTRGRIHIPCIEGGFLTTGQPVGLFF